MTKRVLNLLHVLYATLFFILVLCAADAHSSSLVDELVNHPAQVTSETEPVMHMDLSKDGRLLVYTSGRKDHTDLWLRSADPSRVMLPERLTDNPSEESSPAFSPDNRFVAFAGTGYDVKGDIYIIDLKRKRKRPIRLTGRKTEDGSPCFSSDSKKLYFHQKLPGKDYRQIVCLDLSNVDLKRSSPGKKGYNYNIVDTHGDGAYPSLSPNGNKLAFVSFKDDPSGNILMLDMASGKVTHLTKGPYMDFTPIWPSEPSGSGNTVYFSRIGADTDKDGAVTTSDNISIYKIDTKDPDLLPYPVTPASYSSFRPRAAGNFLFFISDRGKINNCMSLPYEGTIKTKANAPDQIELAEKVSERGPYDPFLTLMAFYKVLEKFSYDSIAGAKAAYEIGKIYKQLNMATQARSSFEIVNKRYSSQVPVNDLCLIEIATIDINKKLRAHKDASKYKAIVEKGILRLENIAKQKTDIVRSRSYIEQARLLKEFSKSPSSLIKAIDLLDRVIDMPDVDKPGLKTGSKTGLKAEAMILKADIYSQVGSPDKVHPIYMSVIKQHENSGIWAQKALDKVLEIAMSKTGSTDVKRDDLKNKVRHLRNLADENKEKYPFLSMGALNRVGDLYFANDMWVKAKETYRQVLYDFPASTTQTTAARMSLAEILYKEERFRKALDLYEAEIGQRVHKDSIYRLARTGYIRKSALSGEYLYGLVEIPAARKVFRELLEYDWSIVEAHRGYIKCAAALKNIDNVLKSYREKLSEKPDDPVTMYSIALSLTYLNNRESLKEARKILLDAISINGQSEYFHQTLGYVYEVLETVYKDENNLEKALESYKKAYFLNDPASNHVNEANLALNIGNMFYLLGQYNNAFEYYSKRMETGVAFDNKNTQIMFYRRMGASAFQIKEKDKTILAYSKTVELIENQIDPQAASMSFDRIHRFVMDRITTPALRDKQLAKRAKTLAKEQTKIKMRMARITSQAYSPPDPKWQIYIDGVEALLKKQEELFVTTVQLLKDYNGNRPKPVKITSNDAEQMLLALLVKVRQDLEFPERLIRLKAEMLDRLGLAFQEAKKHKKAKESFEKVYSLNQRIGIYSNLAGNLRSKAYNTYMLSEKLTGTDKDQALTDAAQDFKTVIDLVKKYGVAKSIKGKSGSAINISIQASTDDTVSTKAAHGFSEDQEIRLANAFIARIFIELGKVIPAQKAIKKQVAAYPSGKPVSDKDTFGVSLLFHRAGLLAYANGKFDEAFDYFYRSSELCINMQSPVSSAINVANMAKTILETDDIDKTRFLQLTTLDRKATTLMEGVGTSFGKPVKAIFHNKIGVYLMSISDKLGSDLESAALKIKSLQKARAHFAKGLNYFNGYDSIKDRQTLGLVSTLHLNLAQLASKLGQHERAKELFKIALDISERTFLSQNKWRALAGLGRLDDAVEVLGAMTVFDAGCGPDEIMSTFAPMVVDLVDKGNIEEAFNLAEKLSEIERFNRTAFMLRDMGKENKNLFKKILPQYERIENIREKIAGASGEEKQDQKEILAKELELVKSLVGKNFTNLPHIVRSIENDYTRETAIVLLGLAAKADELADSIVRKKRKDDDKNLLKLLERYDKKRNEAMGNRPDDNPADLITLFGPEPVEAIDVMDSLPEDGRFIRFFRDPVKRDGKFIVFQVTADDITVTKKSSIKSATKDLNLSEQGTVYAAFENLQMLSNLELKTYALNGSHFYRSFKNRKPFKRTIFAMPPLKYDIKGFEAVSQLLEDRDMKGDVQTINAHTLLLSDKIFTTSTVPTHSQELGAQYLALETEDNGRLHVENVLSNFTGTSLAILPGVSINDAYLTGHLLSMYGCPSVIMPDKTMPDKTMTDKTIPDLKFIGNFLNAYTDESASSALASAVKAQDTSESFSSQNWFILGFSGMTPNESALFARRNFKKYVKKGQKAFKNNMPKEALALFEDAISIAKEVKKYRRHLIKLYSYARESAYRSGNMKKAAKFAEDLSRLTELINPYSEANAEAKLKLGLIFSRLEQYIDAVPALEESLDILADIEPGSKYIQAMADFGVVLENATEYDRALNLFQSAADLSEKMDKKEMLATQHENIGRIYDLRLSQYAPAIDSYKKALALYKEMGRKDLTALSMLDIGRCFRLLGNFTEADRLYIGALKLSEEDYLSIKVKILLELANNAWFQARYEEAFRLQRTSFKIARENNFDLLQVIALNTSGLIWWTLGDNQKALIELDRALLYARKLNKRDDEVATTLNNIGLVYREMGKFPEALAVFQQALAIDTRLKSRWAIAYDLRNKALTLLKMGKAKEAIPLFKEAYTLAHEIGNKINQAKALLGLGEAQLKEGEKKEAEKSFKKALALSDSMAIQETKWRALYGIARLKISEKTSPDDDEAEQLLFDAVHVIEKMRSDIKIEQLKDSFIINKLLVYETLVKLLADKGKIVKAFETSERSRARNFIDLLGSQHLSLKSSVDQNLYDRQRSIRRRINEYETLVALSKNEKRRTMYNKVLKVLNNDYNNIMLDIQAQNPQLGSLISVEPVSADKLFSRVEPDVAFLSYYIVEDELFCWVVRKTAKDKASDINLVRIPVTRDFLGRKILEFRRMIQNLDPLDDLSKELFSLLLPGKVLENIGNVSKLGIIPHGPLHYLSFATLSRGDKFLIDDFSLFYLPSASVMDYTWKKRVEEKNLKVLAIGNPDLGDPVFDLPFSEHEVATIKWNFPDITILTKELATEEWVADNIDGFGIIHMASHGEFSPINPLFSAIKLSGSKESALNRSDGNLEVSEVFGLKINADMVVLSACQTGLGKVTGGDDVIGLNRAFFYAGTHTVISSLWRVSDISTAVMIKQFYRQYRLHEKADSLRLAILHVKNRYPHPGYWGAFTLVGDYY